jgi:hypothetical protein
LRDMEARSCSSWLSAFVRQRPFTLPGGPTKLFCQSGVSAPISGHDLYGSGWPATRVKKSLRMRGCPPPPPLAARVGLLPPNLSSRAGTLRASGRSRRTLTARNSAALRPVVWLRPVMCLLCLFWGRGLWIGHISLPLCTERDQSSSWSIQSYSTSCRSSRERLLYLFSG